MPHIIVLENTEQSVKRLVLNDDGTGTVQEFTIGGRSQIHLSKESMQTIRIHLILGETHVAPATDARWDPSWDTGKAPRYKDPGLEDDVQVEEERS